MSDIPVDAPGHCPGPQSDSAGKASACAGCPNQSACASGQAKLPLALREPEVIAAIRRRLGRVQHRLLILSGKGGVGKSSVSVCLARGLCRRTHTSSGTPEDCFRVGLLDLDLCGPSTPCMLGCMEAQVSVLLPRLFTSIYGFLFSTRC
ncbi:unnamed protein product [Echinostoma caproni]|uniref:Cytosolic Fe-S cluster assembly factor NUBP2 n=1 Tax=Echinostoma caproni TaxID=27848 RepID=A0A183BG91_9TREM|nr:unnamed protein product [Echinostoma caproni]